jgi:hypothetical protein
VICVARDYSGQRRSHCRSVIKSNGARVNRQSRFI